MDSEQSHGSWSPATVARAEALDALSQEKRMKPFNTKSFRPDEHFLRWSGRTPSNSQTGVCREGTKRVERVAIGAS